MLFGVMGILKGLLFTVTFRGTTEVVVVVRITVLTQVILDKKNKALTAVGICVWVIVFYDNRCYELFQYGVL